MGQYQVDRNVERERGRMGLRNAIKPANVSSEIKQDYVKRNLRTIYSHSFSCMSINKASTHRKRITDVSDSLTLLRVVNGVNSDMTDGVNPERIWIIK